MDFDFTQFSTPCFVTDTVLLEKNLRMLRETADAAGCKILLAQKAFSMFSLYPLISRYLDGTTASGLFEARLGHECFGGETHVFCPAYNKREFSQILSMCDHVIFNSLSQWKKFGDIGFGDKFGLRLNPEYSTQECAIYDPCAPFSRMGVTKENLLSALSSEPELLCGISGYHLHTLCEQDSEPLERTFYAAEEKFGEFFKRAKWINLGGGHHITRDGYDKNRLIKLVKYIRDKYGADVYLEPGEAVALNAGYLVSEVADVFKNGMNIAVMDTSAACHMPDVLEMPYRPNIIGADMPGVKKHTYRLGGLTCLAGDIIGDYSFDSPLKTGERLIFCDMAIYSMVKTNTFNGMPLPSIYMIGEDRIPKLVKEFGYSDFKERLS